MGDKTEGSNNVLGRAQEGLCENLWGQEWAGAYGKCSRAIG